MEVYFHKNLQLISSSKLHMFLFLSGGEDNMGRAELASISPSSSTQTSCENCENCHVILKSVGDLGIHKRENHPAVVKQKACSGPLPPDQSTPSLWKSSYGNWKPAPNPVSLHGQI